ncbi:MAG: hypothetical protein ABI634_09880 [Acidobacteriota bacterium]
MPRVMASVVMFVLAFRAAAYAQESQAPQSRRFAVDTVVGYQNYATDYPDWTAQYVFDAFTTAEIHKHWQATFRPKVWRMRNEWHLLIDQASVQTEFHKGSNWRIEAGRFPVPIGLGMTENRADLNGGMIWWHRAYYMPIPFLGADVPRLSLMSAVYPSGVQVSTSAGHWDARGAVVDLSPIEFWREPAGVSRSPNGILGGGVSPWQGFRVGIAGAWGEFAAPTETRGGLGYSMANVEGEYAFKYSKVSGEWTRDRIETSTGDRRSSGWTVQWQQTVTPRLFVHSRASLLHSPEVSRNGPFTVTERTYRSIDTTIGYRLSPTLTVRLGHSSMKSWTTGTSDQQAGVSLMWTNRWW